MPRQPTGNHLLGICDVVRFDLGPLLQVQMRIAKVKSAYKSHIIDHRGLQCETNL